MLSDYGGVEVDAPFSASSHSGTPQDRAVRTQVPASLGGADSEDAEQEDEAFPERVEQEEEDEEEEEQRPNPPTPPSQQSQAIFTDGAIVLAKDAPARSRVVTALQPGPPAAPTPTPSSQAESDASAETPSPRALFTQAPTSAPSSQSSASASAGEGDHSSQPNRPQDRTAARTTLTQIPSPAHAPRTPSPVQKDATAVTAQLSPAKPAVALPPTPIDSPAASSSSSSSSASVGDSRRLSSSSPSGHAPPLMVSPVTPKEVVAGTPQFAALHLHLDSPSSRASSETASEQSKHTSPEHASVSGQQQLAPALNLGQLEATSPAPAPAFLAPKPLQASIAPGGQQAGGSFVKETPRRQSEAAAVTFAQSSQSSPHAQQREDSPPEAEGDQRGHEVLADPSSNPSPGRVSSQVIRSHLGLLFLRLLVRRDVMVPPRVTSAKRLRR